MIQEEQRLIDGVWGETLLDEYALRDLVASFVPMPVAGGERDAWQEDPNLPRFWLLVKPWCLRLPRRSSVLIPIAAQ